MPNQHDDVEDYPPEVQSVIDRFINGEIEYVGPANTRILDVDKKPPKIDKSDWFRDSEKAAKAVRLRKQGRQGW